MASLIQQIALEFNVSNASVSRAINDRPGVSDELRARILHRASELNYTTNVIARGLATSKTFNLGFFIREKPGLAAYNDPFYGRIMHGVQQAVNQSDYHVSIGTITDETIDDPRSFRFVRDGRIDGMILAGPDIPSNFILAMQQSNVPVVLVDNRMEYTRINCVHSDDEGGAYAAARHLIENGHRRVGVISGPVSWSSNARRVSGYRNAFAEVADDVTFAHVDTTTIDSGLEAYQKLIRQNPDITAICAVNDSMAIGAIRAALRDGRQVPRDLSVVGFDDIAWAQLNDPPLTTVNIPKERMGDEAARRLLNLLSDPDAPAVEVTVGVRLVERASSGINTRTDQKRR